MANLPPIPQPPNWRDPDEGGALQPTIAETPPPPVHLESGGMVSSQVRFWEMAWEEFQQSGVYRRMKTPSKFVIFILLTFFCLSILAIGKFLLPLLPVWGWVIIALSTLSLSEVGVVHFLGRFHERSIKELKTAFITERAMLTKAESTVSRPDFVGRIHQVYFGPIQTFSGNGLDEDKLGFEVTIQLSLLNKSDIPTVIEAFLLRVITNEGAFTGRQVQCWDVFYQEKGMPEPTFSLSEYELEKRQYTKETPGIQKWLKFSIDSLTLTDLADNKKSLPDVQEIEIAITDIFGESYPIQGKPPWVEKGILWQ